MTVSSDELTGPALREIRAARKAKQVDFWGALGVGQPSGHAYEQGRRLPASVRKLAWLHYVVGLPVAADFDTLKAVAEAVSGRLEANAHLHRAQVHSQMASESLANALDLTAAVQGKAAKAAV